MQRGDDDVDWIFLSIEEEGRKREIYPKMYGGIIVI